MTRTVLLAGGGKMGGALLQGWLDMVGDGGFDGARIVVVEPNSMAAKALPQGPAADGASLKIVAGVGEIPGDFTPEAIVFALKPQVIKDAIADYSHLMLDRTLVISIAAGVPISVFQAEFGETAAVVRAMPNTPAAIGRGITVACAGRGLDDGQKELCQDLLEAVGEFAWVGEEGLLDAVTAVSGSGPAYVFLLMECLAEAGAEAGLEPELAARLALATVSGAGELARRSADSPTTLRRNVTSPNGTTEAALKVLMGSSGLGPLLKAAVAAAAARSRELAD
jgi:pyrroline-5-carboxylate reductase